MKKTNLRGLESRCLPRSNPSTKTTNLLRFGLYFRNRSTLVTSCMEKYFSRDGNWKEHDSRMPNRDRPEHGSNVNVNVLDM
jgi:hypothetical protein